MGGDSPASLTDFDTWVLRTVLNPQLPLFREARYLLAEETEIRDTALYHAVLGAIASGNATRGGIASHIGRKSTDIGHPLAVLEDAQLIARETDPFRKGRSLYRITEPLIIFYEAVMRREWTRLERGDTAGAWHNSRPRSCLRWSGRISGLSAVTGRCLRELRCSARRRVRSRQAWWPIRSAAARSRSTWPSSRRTSQGARAGCYL